MQTKIAVVVFHPSGELTIKGFVFAKNEPLPDTFGLNGAIPVHLTKLASASKSFQMIKTKTFDQGPGALLQVHPEFAKPSNEPPKTSQHGQQ